VAVYLVTYCSFAPHHKSSACSATATGLLGKTHSRRKAGKPETASKEKTILAGTAVSFNSIENLPPNHLFLQDIFSVKAPYLGGKIEFFFLRSTPTVITSLFLRAS